MPVAGRETPFPKSKQISQWKQIVFVGDTLPERDRQKALQMPAIDIMDYIRTMEGCKAALLMAWRSLRKGMKFGLGLAVEGQTLRAVATRSVAPSGTATGRQRR